MTMRDEITGPYVGPTPPPSGTRFAPGELLAGRYRVLAPLGRGGMGEVYRVDDLALGQPVALKFLPPHLASEPDRLARFRKEVATARAVSHPNVCRVYDLGDHAGQLFLAMEYIDGEDLASLLRRVGRVSEEKGVEIARQLCLALAAVHGQGLLHRDLKPHNVMLDGRGKVRLTDFGLAAAATDISGAEHSPPSAIRPPRPPRRTGPSCSPQPVSTSRSSGGPTHSGTRWRPQTTAPPGRAPIPAAPTCRYGSRPARGGAGRPSSSCSPKPGRSRSASRRVRASRFGCSLPS
jgi:serine/threonine protein kinase